MGVLHDTSRKAKQSDFVGKTIKSIDASADSRPMDWQDISTAPKDGTVIDVWLKGTLSDIKFYCSTPPHKIRRGEYGGRSVAWHYLNGKFRPFLGGLTLTTFIEPTHWQPLPSPPK